MCYPQQWTLKDFERENEELFRAAEEIDRLRREEEEAEIRYMKSQQKTNAAWADYVAASKDRDWETSHRGREP